MKKISLILSSILYLSLHAQKEIVLSQDSTKRTWDFFKYFMPPSAGTLNDMFEPSACIKTAEKYYNEANSKFEKLWNDFNAGDKSYKKIKNAEKQTANTCKGHFYDATAYKSSVQTQLINFFNPRLLKEAYQHSL